MPDLIMFRKTSLTGGGATAVDGISATSLVGEELCFTTVAEVDSIYRMNATSAATADGINIIIPVVGTVGDKRWIRQKRHFATIVSEEVTFTETTGAGVYTGSVFVPAGATLIDIQVQSTTLWNTTTSATMIVGDGADPNGFYDAIDLKATDLLVDEVIRFGSTGGKEGAYIVVATGELNSYSATARTITGSITTVGAAGSAGRTRMLVIYALPTVTTATKA